MLLIAIALIVLGALLSLANWYTLFAYLWSGRHSSVVPLFGAMLLGSGVAMIPETRPFAWLAVVADYGTLILIISLPRLAYAFWSTSIFNQITVFRTDDAERRIEIKLFRRGIAIIQMLFHQPLPNGAGGIAVGLSWMGTWTPVDGGYSVMGYAPDRELLVSPQNGVYRTRESGYPAEKKETHDSLDGLTLREA
jgi:hypothetical protein